MSYLTKNEIILIAAITSVVIIGVIGKTLNNKKRGTITLTAHQESLSVVQDVNSDSILSVLELDTLSDSLNISGVDIEEEINEIVKDREQVLFPVDINHASAGQLEILPGIGPVIAGRIVEYRISNGPFVNKGDLLLIKGIGPVKYSKIESLVVITY